MTMLLDDAGYDEFRRHLSAEGVAFDDLPLNDASTPSGETALPDAKTVKRLHAASYGEFLSSESARKEPMALVETYWKRYNLQPYDPEELLLAEQINLTTPLIRSRVDQVTGSLYQALSMSPFFTPTIEPGQDGTLATHAELAFEEQMQAADFDNAFSQGLKGSGVATLGVLKVGIALDDGGEPRLDVEAVDLRDLFLSPHNVRDLQQCTLIAHRYYEPLGWVRDQALAGLFDRKATDEVAPSTARDSTDANATERDFHHLPAAEGMGGESAMVELLEVYVRSRPDPKNPSETWRLIVARTGWKVLRAEQWEDGFPFWPLRLERGQNTIFAPSFAAVLKDLQFGKDMLFSLSFEQNRMSVAPFAEYDPLSPAGEWLQQRAAEAKNGTVRILPGDLIPSRMGQQSIRLTYHPPANMAVSQAMNEIEAMAGTATVPSLPMQTYRSATEHRFAQATVTSKEAQMLRVVRADLTRFAEYAKRLFWKYVATPADGGGKYIRHGSQLYLCKEDAFLALRFEPRGTTTQADQMQVAAASGEALQLSLTLGAQKPLLMQAGSWPFVYEAARMRLEALGFRETQKVLGPPPTTDPNLVNLDPNAQQAAMLLMQAQAGQPPMEQGQPGQALRGSDAAPTVMPGGNPLGPGVN